MRGPCAAHQQVADRVLVDLLGGRPQPRIAGQFLEIVRPQLERQVEAAFGEGLDRRLGVGQHPEGDAVEQGRRRSPQVALQEGLVARPAFDHEGSAADQPAVAAQGHRGAHVGEQGKEKAISRSSSMVSDSGAATCRPRISGASPAKNGGRSGHRAEDHLQPVAAPPHRTLRRPA